MKVEDIEPLVRPNISRLCPYSTARDEYGGGIGVFLDANESPYPTGWNRYPDPGQKALKKKISSIKGVPEGNIFLGNGSDEAIDLVFRIFCIPGIDNAVAISPSYGMYSVSAATNDIALRTVLLNGDFSLPVERILKACDAHTKVIFLCSPNNPTGNAFPEGDIMEVVEKFNGMVVVDEAYIDFSDTPGLTAELADHPNLIVLQTLSKARGLASLRLGMAFACRRVISLMSMVKYPYNINGSTQALALKALENPVEAQVAEIIGERGRVAEALRGFRCIKKVYPSNANFLLVETADADALYDFLISRGIIVRNRTRMDLCSNCLRITIGLPGENEKMLNAIEDYEKSDIR